MLVLSVVITFYPRQYIEYMTYSIIILLTKYDRYSITDVTFTVIVTVMAQLATLFALDTRLISGHSVLVHNKNTWNSFFYLLLYG